MPQSAASLSSMVQAGVQGLFRPAMWLPFIKRLHSHKERWRCEGSQLEFRNGVLKAIEKMAELDVTGSFYDYHVIKDDFIRVFVFTWAEWLDVIEIKFFGNEAQVVSFSSGFLPLFIPFACVINLAFFWVPFYDKKLNRDRLERLRASSPLLVDTM